MQMVALEVVSGREFRQLNLQSVYASFCIKKNKTLNYVVTVGSQLMTGLIQVQG